MARNRNRRTAAEEEESQDLKRQERIFLLTFGLMIILLVSLYLGLYPISTIAAVVLVASTIGFYIKHKEFYKMRDRGQRTWCVTISMYLSLIVTIGCAWYFTKDAPMTMDYALVFLFGYMFFVYMVYRTLSPTMVVGNKRRR